jgi:hypothetical protein
MEIGVSSIRYDKDLAIVIQSEAQYYAIEPLLEHLKQTNRYSFDVIVNPMNGEESGHREIARATKRLIHQCGLEVVFSKKSEYSYKLLLAPYEDLAEVDYKYALQYLYAVISAKPNPVYKPEFMRNFHGVLCHSTYERDILCVYAQTHIVSSLKYKRPLEHSIVDSNNKTILFLPTYGSNINSMVKTILRLRSKGYYIITKLHHGTQHLYSEKTRKEQLQLVSNKTYGSEVSLSSLLQCSMAVICGNTGAIFEAMYAGVPVFFLMTTPMNTPWLG